MKTINIAPKIDLNIMDPLKYEIKMTQLVFLSIVILQGRLSKVINYKFLILI